MSGYDGLLPLSEAIMRRRSRRRFLKRSAALVPALTWMGSREASAQQESRAQPVPAVEEGELLRALAEVVLPAEIGAGARSGAIERFVHWYEAFEPVAELDHPYLSSDEIRYGPPDPRPLWQAQLEALELEARKRHGRGFVELRPAQRERLLRRQLPRRLPQSLMHPSEAPHVALALCAWFFSSPEANDLCYGAQIGRHECRGLPGVEKPPAPLASSGSVGGRR